MHQPRVVAHAPNQFVLSRPPWRLAHASRSRHKSGVGSALFARTREAASKLGFTAINASIRVENAGGLAYYSRVGFETYLVEAGDPQAQHRVFNRVHKRFDLAQG